MIKGNKLIKIVEGTAEEIEELKKKVISLPPLN